MRRVSWIILFAAALFISSAYAEAPGKTLTLVADPWCPYDCKPGSADPGILLEIAQRAFAKEGMKVRFESVPWTRAIEETRRGNYNAIVSAAVADAPDFVFPDIPQYDMHSAFFTLPDSKWVFKDVGSFSGTTIGVVADYAYNDAIDAYVKENIKDTNKVQAAPGESALDINVKKLMAGRIGAFVEDVNVVKFYLRSHPEFQGKLRRAGDLPPSDTNHLHVAFSPKNPDSKHYAALVAAETRELQKSGELKKIAEKYLGNSAE